MPEVTKPICANCKHCVVPRDAKTLPIRESMTWLCAAAEPYSVSPARVSSLTGEQVPERRVLVPCHWYNRGDCELFEAGEQVQSSEQAYPPPNSMMWEHPRDRAAQAAVNKFTGSYAQSKPVSSDVQPSASTMVLATIAIAVLTTLATFLLAG